MSAAEVQQRVTARWPARVRATVRDGPAARAPACIVDVDAPVLAAVCGWVVLELGYSLAGLVVEEGTTTWLLRYLFYGARGAAWIEVLLTPPHTVQAVPSIVRLVHAADWHEREAEDLFGLHFEGHPRLGDFVLHDDAWQEGVAPMRHAFGAQTPVTDRRPNTGWRPHRVLEAPGAFVMPIGPVFSAVAESAHFLLETVGEDVTRALPRLFYTYRGVEKIAEGRSVGDVLLLAERFAATTAFGHALAYCTAVEAIAGAEVPARAEALRLVLAELERVRHHAGAIAAICESTGLVVAASEAALFEEELLRVTGALVGHRYLFGMVTPGGLTTDVPNAACDAALRQCRSIVAGIDRLEGRLRGASSFLDRLEEAGTITQRDARAVGLVGPVARGSGVARDLREAQPYGMYARCTVAVPSEREGDGYARLRVLFAEIRESVRLMAQGVAALVPGPVWCPVQLRTGSALGWAEAPRGAAFHWVHLGEDLRVVRYHIVPPSFANWLGFHLGVERFAFQDFPIILSTLDLSVAENDR